MACRGNKQSTYLDQTLMKFSSSRRIVAEFALVKSCSPCGSIYHERISMLRFYAPGSSTPNALSAVNRSGNTAGGIGLTQAFGMPWRLLRELLATGAACHMPSAFRLVPRRRRSDESSQFGIDNSARHTPGLLINSSHNSRTQLIRRNTQTRCRGTRLRADRRQISAM